MKPSVCELLTLALVSLCAGMLLGPLLFPGSGGRFDARSLPPPGFEIYTDNCGNYAWGVDGEIATATARSSPSAAAKEAWKVYTGIIEEERIVWMPVVGP